jgi:predicted alpha/beta superfamily hydrolase
MAIMENLYFELTTNPEDDRPVYVAGNFTEWYPDVSAFKMEPIGAGKYRLVFPTDYALPDVLEYKYTRGGWDQVELGLDGQPTQNRTCRRKTGTRRDTVAHWRHNGLAYNAKLMPKSKLVSEEFVIPQLGDRKRAVHVLLPHNYDKTQKRYPVLYMQDAQNLFGEGSSYGNWEIDKKMAILSGRGHGEVIIVAIEHGGESRNQEYNPYDAPRLGLSEGRKYVQFLAETLKPYIDQHYRTQPERLHSGIGGSSLGGLISIYAGLMYPHVFSKLMVFSPSLWVSSKIFFDAIHFFEPLDTRIYVYAGGKEGANMIPNVRKLNEALEKQSFNNERVAIKLVTDAKGKHSESRWGQEFPKAFEWLFFPEKK